ncbi:hypothetical protein Patl1_05614 [Pistacia atlantica]|uniref:Uncharacterized protein n=1 Tax=Pistacia atlantica TaxID=434234 RepID=A0ACC1BSB3_9ROSI|nr:hypothetical protein Patl1_05614 [Pistacia atlantica]
MSTRFNLCLEMILSSRVDDNNAAYVEIILDIFEDSLAIHSVQGVTVHEDPELFSLVKKATENKSSSSSVRFSLFRKTCSHIKQGFQELKVHLASFTK